MPTFSTGPQSSAGPPVSVGAEMDGYVDLSAAAAAMMAGPAKTSESHSYVYTCTYICLDILDLPPVHTLHVRYYTYSGVTHNIAEFTTEHAHQLMLIMYMYVHVHIIIINLA